MRRQRLTANAALLLCSLVVLLAGWNGTSVAAQQPEIDLAVALALGEYRATSGSPFYYREVGRTVDGAVGGIVFAELVDQNTDEVMPGIVDWLVVVNRDGVWRVVLPGDPGYSTAYAGLPPSVLRQVDDTPYRTLGDPDIARALDLGSYQFPWEDGLWATVTRSFNVHGVGNLDVDLTGRNVTAAKDGTIIYASDDQSVNAYQTGAWWYWNTIIIQHGPNEFSLYGHLENDSIPQAIRDACLPSSQRLNCFVPVRAGDVIGREGNSGYSSNPHLHVEFGQNAAVVAYLDAMDADGDGDRRERVYSGYIYGEHNVGFRGSRSTEVAAWTLGTLQQASHRPAPPLGENIVRNGDFSAGTDGWNPSGQVDWNEADGAMEFTRIRTAEPPDWASFYQVLEYGMFPNTVVEVVAELGNSSGVPKTISVSLANAAGQHYGVVTCAFTIPASTGLAAYQMLAQIPGTWATTRLEFTVNPADSASAALVDNVVVRRRADASVSGTNCGEYVPADRLLALLARDLLQRMPGATIVFDVKSSQALPNEIRKYGGVPLMWKTGHSLMKLKMHEVGSPLGGEVSGHLFTGEDYFGFDDAPLIALRTLEVISKSNKTVAELFEDIPKLVATPEIILSAPDNLKFQIIQEITDTLAQKYEVITLDGVRAQFEDGWGLVRASNTQPAITMRFEATTRAQVVEYMERFKRLLQQRPEIDLTRLNEQIDNFKAPEANGY